MLLSPHLPVELQGYLLTEELHRGKHTVVLRGTRGHDGLPVVIKALNADSSTFNDTVKLHHEHAIIADIRGSGVVRTFGMEKQGRVLAIILEDFGGISLAEYLASARLDIPAFLRIAIQLCTALQEIHAAHVIHLDINPSNIIINPATQRVKIIDFGISTRLSSERVRSVNPNVLEGTLPYISPEQTGRMNRVVDYRADYYALGITLYEALIGWVPFQSSDPMELLHCHIAKHPAVLAELNAAIPKPVSDIVMKLLAKTAEDRYQSAAGLRTDLEQCLLRWQASGSIAEFPLGTADISEKFQIPQKLYGRDEQIAALLESFEAVCAGRPGVLLVSGEAGIGKSALVHEVHKPIVRRRGFFVSGKFDQFKRDIPYAPLTQALRDLIDQLLASSPDQLDQWRSRLGAALGPNGRVLSSVIPEIELIVGEQPALQDLPPKESQNRFNSVILEFVHAVATADHPLVLFLDDLQWADQASLDLIHQLLADPALKYVFLIGAYRGDEPGSSPLLAMLENALTSSGVDIRRVALPPLSADAVSRLIGDTLRLSQEECRPLAFLVSSKTGGNPFFVNEFLKTLHYDGLVRFQQELRRWTWNIDDIRQKEITENVAAMMTANIQRLPVRTQQSLQLAACIGNSFGLESLSRVRKRTQAAVAVELWPAIKDGLIIPVGDAYKYLQSASETEGSVDIGVPVHFSDVSYRFAHDRVQQSAYALIPSGEASRTHYEIGQSLLGSMEEDGRQDALYAAANHLNLGRQHMVQPRERVMLITLNLRAGKRAMASAAFAPALRYFAAGYACAAPEDAAALYETLRDLLMYKGECEYLTGAFAAAEASFDTALGMVKTPAEQGRVYGLKIELFIHRSQIDRALDTALTALNVLGVRLPVNPGKLAVVREMLVVRSRVGRRKVPDLIDLPPMRSEEPRVAMNILMSLFSIAYSLSEEFSGLVISRMMNLTLRHGNADVSAYTYELYGLLVRSGFRAFDAGRDLGLLGLSLSERFDNRLLRGRCNFVYGCLHNHWYRHASTNREYLSEAYRHATENGDQLYASYALSQQTIVDMVTGVPLPTVFSNASAHLAFASTIQHEDIAFYFEAARFWAANLLGKTDNAGPGTNKQQDESAFRDRMESSTYVPPKMFNRFVQVQIHYLRGEYEEALKVIEQSATMQHALIGQCVEAEFSFYHCLTLLALAATSSIARRRRYLKEVAAGQRSMMRWAEHAPANFAHKRDLIGAERARVEGNAAQAMQLYDNSIAGARENGFIQHEGLAHERAGEFYLALGRDKVASTYLAEARSCYETWGAAGLVRLLESRHGRLLPVRGEDRTATRSTSARSSTTTTTGAQTLDLISVLKASQTLSGEIVLPRLLERMMHIVLENAGAQRGLLIMEKGDRLMIEAEGTMGSTAPVVLQSIPLEQSEELSGAIVRYVARLRQNVVLDDAESEGAFVTDPYVLRTHPKSILCMPIEHQGNLSGILYLENNLSTNAFTPARLEILRLLSSQIAVSMENARLYAQERELVRMQEEFRLAAKIQQELLPSRSPALEGYEISGRNIPARMVGGDYFDFIRIDDHRLAICIGDVSGKGLPASLLMANLQASLRGQSMLTASPSECLARSNRLLFESTSPEKFATVFYGVLDTSTHRFRCCNGGHEYPLLLSRSGGCRELTAGGIALGMLESFPFGEEEVELHPGDLLVMYSDGITEAMNPADIQFGRDHLADLLREARQLPLEGLTAKVVDAVKAHAGNAPQSDDITLVAIRRIDASTA